MTNSLTALAHTDGVAQEKLDREIEAGGVSDYAAPEMVSLGSSKSLIQGYWNEGWVDWADHYKHAGE
jgi:hypothetical protein